MTVTTLNPTADGLVECHSVTYLNAARGTGTLIAYPSETSFGYAGQVLSGEYYCDESFYQFDTSAIPDTDTIDSVVFSLYGHLDESVTNFILQARIYDWGAGPVTTADFQPSNTLGALTLVATITSSGWNTGGYNNLVSEAAFVGQINKTGTTYIVTHSDRHMNETTPSGSERVGAHNVEHASADHRPQLVVTHTAAGAAADVVDPMGMTGFFGA